MEFGTNFSYLIIFSVKDSKHQSMKMLWNKSNNNWMEEMLDFQLHKKFAYLLLLTCLCLCFFANFFTWLRVKNKPICWCTNWNSPFILGDISLLKIAKFLYSLGIEAPKKRVLYHVFTAGLGMLLLCMQNEIHAQRVQVRALLHF